MACAAMRAIQSSGVRCLKAPYGSMSCCAMPFRLSSCAQNSVPCTPGASLRMSLVMFFESTSVQVTEATGWKRSLVVLVNVVPKAMRSASSASASSSDESGSRAAAAGLGATGECTDSEGEGEESVERALKGVVQRCSPRGESSAEESLHVRRPMEFGLPKLEPRQDTGESWDMRARAFAAAARPPPSCDTGTSSSGLDGAEESSYTAESAR